MSDLESGTWLRRLAVGHGDDTRYPVAVMNRDTGRVSYRLSRPGEGNKKSVAIETDDEETVIEAVLKKGYGVRVSGPRHRTPSILYPHKQTFRLT